MFQGSYPITTSNSDVKPTLKLILIVDLITTKWSNMALSYNLNGNFMAWSDVVVVTNQIKSELLRSYYSFTLNKHHNCSLDVTKTTILSFYIFIYSLNILTSCWLPSSKQNPWSHPCLLTNNYFTTYKSC
ncbi:hypothetical protein [Candidatus Hodgkinia cicadicola]|uniref:hypothetical protein n=1 Tax=Candidatus Hodgkinia cicadicola TaxID=573658 RepID=UPI0011BA7EFF